MPRPPSFCGPSSSAPASPPAPAPVSSPIGAIVSLNGHRAVKCSPSQILHFTFLSFSWAFTLSFSGFSSLPSFFHVTLGRNMMFSPTLVVSKLGPTAFPFSCPNFAQARRSATRGLTVSLTTVVRIRLVVFTFLPSSLKRYDITVLVPSLFVVICWGGRVVVSSKSSSSAQSARL